MTTDNKTLADARPGGRVRLADQALSTTELRRNAHVLVLQELRARFTDAGSPSRRAALDAAIAALSAQPSPGGQDALEMVGANLRSIMRLCRPEDYSISRLDAANIHMEALHALQLLEAALAARQPISETDAYQQGFREGQDRTCTVAARQPVGEPVVTYCGRRLTPEGTRECWGVLSAGVEDLPQGTKLYAAPHAQAVDLGDFKALYRAYVRLLESGRDRIRDLGGACDPVDVMEANDVDLQAARRVLDSQAVGK